MRTIRRIDFDTSLQDSGAAIYQVASRANNSGKQDFDPASARPPAGIGTKFSDVADCSVVRAVD